MEGGINKQAGLTRLNVLPYKYSLMADINRRKIVHLLSPDKFTLPFIDLVNREFGSDNHLFLLTSKPDEAVTQNLPNIRWLRNPYRRYFIDNTLIFSGCVRNASKIILHGNPLLFYFLIFPYLPRKTFWVIYGYEIDDNYFKIKRPLIERIIRNHVFKRIYGHITHIEGDSDFVNLHFKATAKFFYSPIYLSNVVFKGNSLAPNSEKLNKCLNILVGNNTSPTNNHDSIFQMLLPYKEENIKIFCPLSYGTYNDYRDKVIEKGKEYFGERFIPITQFMKPDEYLNFLESIDIAIFNHQRQEGMGVIIQLISLGKIIFMNPMTTSYKSFINRGFRVFDNALVSDYGLFAERDISGNPELAETFYGYERLVSSWDTIFRY